MKRVKHTKEVYNHEKLLIQFWYLFLHGKIAAVAILAIMPYFLPNWNFYHNQIDNRRNWKRLPNLFQNDFS